MDGIAIWLLFLIFLPFLLFFWKLLLMAWKSFLLTKKLKNSSEIIDTLLAAMARNISFDWTENIPPSFITPPSVPIIVNPNDSYQVSQGFAVYGCFLGILVFIFVVLIVKIAFKRKRFQARNATLRQHIASRQNQLSTVSYSVDVNSNRSNGRTNNRRGSNATLKIDQPPTYEEVMKNFVDLRERAETSTTAAGDMNANEGRNTFGILEIESGTIATSEQRGVV